MFRYTRLILAVLLTGCATQAGENTELPIPLYPEPLKVQPNNDLLATVEATLDVADRAIDEILEDKIKTRNKISNLRTVVDKEEQLLNTLEEKIGVKDSLLKQYQVNALILEQKIQNVEDNLNHALHKCGNECYPTIKRLNQENQDLLNYVDSLEIWVFYLDSLVSTNKKLSKKLSK